MDLALAPAATGEETIQHHLTSVAPRNHHDEMGP